MRAASLERLLTEARHDLAEKMIAAVTAQRRTITLEDKPEYIGQILWEQSVEAANEQNEVIDDCLDAMRRVAKEAGINLNDKQVGK